jgi:peptidoglycan LD-endopeptidase CwlK
MSRNIADLSPEMYPLVKEWEKQMNEAGIDYLITCTKRTIEEQAKLYAQGRTTPGPKVTWTMHSKHLTGNAFDFVVMVNGKPDWKMVQKESWNKAVAIGKSLGMDQVVGNDGRVKEFAHLQI